MTVLRLSVSTALLAASIQAGHAGPCSVRIDQVMTSVEAKLGTRAAGGASARESTGALVHRQPTPKSIASAEEGLGEVSTEKVELVTQAMTRARSADNAGDVKACSEALDEVQREIGP